MEKLLYKNYKNKGLCFALGRRTPRQNEFENRCKWFLLWGYSDEVNLYTTGYHFETIKDARKWIKENYFVFL